MCLDYAFSLKLCLNVILKQFCVLMLTIVVRHFLKTNKKDRISSVVICQTLIFTCDYFGMKIMGNLLTTILYYVQFKIMFM